jgi:hypothetical protein
MVSSSHGRQKALGLNISHNAFHSMTELDFLQDSDSRNVQRRSISEERARIQRRVSGFDWANSLIWAHLQHAFGPRLNQNELVSIAELVSQRLRIKLDRDARRRKAVMIKWFHENWQFILPVLRYVVLDPCEPEP